LICIHVQFSGDPDNRLRACGKISAILYLIFSELVNRFRESNLIEEYLRKFNNSFDRIVSAGQIAKQWKNEAKMQSMPPESGSRRRIPPSIKDTV